MHPVTSAAVIYIRLLTDQIRLWRAPKKIQCSRNPDVSNYWNRSELANRFGSKQGCKHMYGQKRERLSKPSPRGKFPGTYIIVMNLVIILQWKITVNTFKYYINVLCIFIKLNECINQQQKSNSWKNLHSNFIKSKHVNKNKLLLVLF